MNITKEILKEIDHIELGLENCDGYNIAPENILDIWFDEIQFGVGYNKENEVHDGQIVISKNAFKLLGDFAYTEYVDGTTELDHNPEDEYYLYNRLMMCCDICQVHIVYKNGERLCLFVDYDPIINEMTYNEIDFSNCPSAELDENGDMLILFGKSSSCFKRTDNDYSTYIEGFDKIISKRLKSVLCVKVIELGNGGTLCWSPDNGLYAEFKILNKGLCSKDLPLQFFDVQELTFYFDFKNIGKEDFLVSPTEDGRFFVQIGALCNFYCTKIKVFEGF